MSFISCLRLPFTIFATKFNSTQNLTGDIAVSDTEEGRTIWNKKFPWVKCEICGKIVSTEKHYKASTGSDTVICPDCRKKAITDIFAETLGEE